MAKKYLFPYAKADGRCHDCNVLVGEVHYEGCDVERCAHCLKQAIGCDCKMDTPFSYRIPFGLEDKRIRKVIEEFNK